MHIQMIQDKNGNRTIIDTLIENHKNFDVNAFLRSKGIADPEKKTSKMIFLDADREQLDSLIEHAGELRALSKQLSTNLPPVPPVPPFPDSTQMRKMTSIYIRSNGADTTDFKNQRVLMNAVSEQHLDSLIAHASELHGLFLLKDKGIPEVPPFPPVPPSPDSSFFKSSDWVGFRQFMTNRSGLIDTFIMMGPAIEMTGISLAESFRQLDSIKLHVKILRLDKDEMLERKDAANENEPDIEQLSIYPNPNNGLFKLRFSLSEKNTTVINITEPNGKVIFSEKLKAFSGVYEKEIDLSSQAKGIYFLTVKQGKQSAVRKLLIQ